MLHSNRLVPALLSLAVLSGLLAGSAGRSSLSARAAPLQQAATSVVISEFRPRGPAGGTDEFVELYNPTGNSVDISDWKINTSDAQGTASTLATVPANTTLQTGQYYLIENSAGKPFDPAWDLSYSLGNIPDDGGVAVLDSLGSIVDQVGMSTGSLYKEPADGTGILSSLTTDTDQSYERKAGGASDSCIDTNINSDDFSLRNPSDPQNSLAPRSDCGRPLNAATTATTITPVPPATVLVGESVPIQFQVTETRPGPGTPTGLVTVTDGLDTCRIDVTAGQCSLTFTSSGTKSITVKYEGDGTFIGSISTAVQLQVNKADTTTTLTDSTNPSVVGQAFSVQYSVAAVAPGSGSPTGTVTVSDGTNSCTGTIASGQCTLTYASVGTRNLTASYSGDAGFNSSVSSSVAHIVNMASTTTSILSASPEPSTISGVVTVSYSVTVNSPGAGAPTGNVTITVTGEAATCTGTIASGQCALTFTTAGTKTLKATYAGDGNFNASSSPDRTHSVVAGLPATPVAYAPLSVLINEVAWAGTAASSTDEWMELYNPGTVGIDLTGWTLRTADGSVNLTWTATSDIANDPNDRFIEAGSYYLLERTDDNTVSDIPADKLYTGDLSDSGEILYLYDARGERIDTANIDGGGWPAGSLGSTLYPPRSMERRGILLDSSTAWVTNTGLVKYGLDAGIPSGCTPPNCTTAPRAIYGTPRHKNWATTVTLTPSPRPPTAVPTRLPPPQPRPIINEFLPRAGFDWNQDGKVDVFDEFIEVANLGPADWRTKGWRLDDEANSGSAPYTLPDMVLKPGERTVFYALQTNINLSDGGDTVRLISSSGVVFDAQTYPVVKTADQSWCRLPDLRGSWYPDCFPTPNQPNTRTGQLPAAPPGTGLEEPLCRLADTLPEDFILAECRAFGENMWSARFWDLTGWKGDLPVVQNGSKWETFVQ